MPREKHRSRGPLARTSSGDAVRARPAADPVVCVVVHWIAINGRSRVGVAAPTAVDTLEWLGGRPAKARCYLSPIIVFALQSSVLHGVGER